MTSGINLSQQYEVESIDDKKKEENGGTFYLLKWKGLEQRTWEPSHRLTQREMIMAKNFEERQRTYGRKYCGYQVFGSTSTLEIQRSEQETAELTRQLEIIREMQNNAVETGAIAIETESPNEEQVGPMAINESLEIRYRSTARIPKKMRPVPPPPLSQSMRGSPPPPPKEDEIEIKWPLGYTKKYRILEPYTQTYTPKKRQRTAPITPASIPVNDHMKNEPTSRIEPLLSQIMWNNSQGVYEPAYTKL